MHSEDGLPPRDRLGAASPGPVAQASPRAGFGLLSELFSCLAMSDCCAREEPSRVFRGSFSHGVPGSVASLRLRAKERSDGLMVRLYSGWWLL